MMKLFEELLAVIARDRHAALVREERIEELEAKLAKAAAAMQAQEAQS